MPRQKVSLVLLTPGKEPEAEAEDNHVLTMMAVVAIVVIDDDSDDHDDENTYENSYSSRDRNEAQIGTWFKK